MKDIAEILGELPFFDGLAAEHARFIAGCGRNAVYLSGEFLLRSGEPATSFFVVRRGKVSLEISPPGRDPFVFGTVPEGGVLGWSWLIEPHITQFDARAVEDTHVIQFDGDCLRSKCAADPVLGFDLVKRFTKVLVQRFTDTRLQLLDVYGKRR